MKKIVCITILTGLLCSCTGVVYKSPQPLNGENLTEFPKKMRGTFLIMEMDKETEFDDADTIGIKSNYYEDYSIGEKIYLSDSVVLKEFKKRYYISLKSYNQDYWIVAQIIIESDNKLTVNAVYDAEDDEDLYVENVNNITAVSVIKNKKDISKYLINPTQKELEKLSKKNFFKPVYEFIRIQK